MPEIFVRHAPEYAQLVSRQDYMGKLLPALQRLHPLEGADVVEVGAGTGRFTCMLAPLVKSIRASDLVPQTLEVARENLAKLSTHNWRVDQADNRDIPVESASADISLAGWTLAMHMLSDDWKANIDKALGEMLRVLRPGGTCIIFEPLGTCSEPPRSPPMADLTALYAYLEDERGFESTQLRTDYRFESLEEAQHLTRLFFGDEVAARLEREKECILTEDTVLFWKHV